MNDIIEFIKEALAGKKMDAKWIVTIAVAVAGLAWSGTLLWQEYQGMQSRLADLESISHEKTPEYDDVTLRAIADDNMNRVIALETIVADQKAEIDRLRGMSEADTKAIERIDTELRNVRTESNTADANIRQEVANKNQTILNKMTDMENNLRRDIDRNEESAKAGVNPLSM